MNNRNICKICKGGGILVHKGTRDNALIDVYKCNVCGTKFLSVIKDYDYENGFMNKTDHMPDQEIEARIRLCQRDDLRRFHMVEQYCKDKSVLDFGCGFGGFLKYVSETASDCTGVELGRDERNYLKKEGILCTPQIEELNKKYDVITLFHCFEHLSEPQMWLEKFSHYLKPEGKLIIEVPNAEDALLELYESQEFADFTYWSAHLFLYTMKSLTMLIEETGKYRIEAAKQVQRYPISNHLMWLAKQRPAGHERWAFIDSEELNIAYTRKLQELQMCDTLFFIMSLN